MIQFQTVSEVCEPRQCHHHVVLLTVARPRVNLSPPTHPAASFINIHRPRAAVYRRHHCRRADRRAVSRFAVFTVLLLVRARARLAVQYDCSYDNIAVSRTKHDDCVANWPISRAVLRAFDTCKYDDSTGIRGIYPNCRNRSNSTYLPTQAATEKWKRNASQVQNDFIQLLAKH